MKTRHYIAVRVDCNVVHPEAICSPHRLQITFLRHQRLNAHKPHKKACTRWEWFNTAPVWFWSGWSGVLLWSCKVAYLFMVINAADIAANFTPACPPLSLASMQLLLTLSNCSARMQHGLCGHLSSKQCLQSTK